MKYFEWYKKYIGETKSKPREDCKLVSDWKRYNIYLDKNEKNYPKDVFISDGIVDPDKWFDQDIRPLFVLKEAYGGDHDWNEIDWFFRNEEKSSQSILDPTWRTICHWASYVFDKKYDCDSISWGNDVFKKIAVINIKKYGGIESSVNKDLKRHAEKHYENIFNQINLIKPTLIICGYTGWLLDIVWQSKGLKRIRGKDHHFRIYDVKGLDCEKVRLIDFWHPSAWVANVGKDFAGLTEAFMHDVDVALDPSPLPTIGKNKNTRH